MNQVKGYAITEFFGNDRMNETHYAITKNGTVYKTRSFHMEERTERAIFGGTEGKWTKCELTTEEREAMEFIGDYDVELPADER